MKPSFLIPAFEPDHRMVELVDRLLALGADDLIVIDDGSHRDKQALFDGLARKTGVTVLRHAVNLGKGRALKTGLNHYLLNRGPESPGVVTLDADGQHLPEDVMKVALELERDPASFH